MSRFSKGADSIAHLIERLRATRDSREAIHLLHDLSDLEIGRRDWGMSLEREYEPRLRVLMEFGSYSNGLLPGHLSAEDQAVRDKARSVLHSLLRGMDGPRAKPPDCSLISSGLVLELCQLFGDFGYRPAREQECAWVQNWLLAVYASLRTKGFRVRKTPDILLHDVERLRRDYQQRAQRFIEAKQHEVAKAYESLYQAVVQALVCADEMSIFLEEEDLAALPALERYARYRERNDPHHSGGVGLHPLPSLEEALVYGRQDTHGPRFQAAAVAIALRHLKSGQLDLAF